MGVQLPAAGFVSYPASTAADEGESRRMKTAVNFAYTLNHALVCTATDPLTDIPIGIFIQKKLGNKEEGATRHWLLGEMLGDFGAVPAVVALRHFAPSLMNGIGKVIEPVAKPFLKRTAERSARKEQALGGGTPDEQTVQARAEELYQRETEHLPDALMWTALSPLFNIAVQKMAGNQTPIPHLLAGKAVGSAVTSSLTVGLRNVSPRKAQQWDDFLTGKVIGPVSSAVAHLFGLDKDAIKAGVAKRQQGEAETQGWAAKEEARRAGNTEIPRSI